MFEYRRKPSLTAKALTVCAIGMGVGFGTCGLTLLTTGGSGGSQFLSVAGAGLFALSLVGAVATIIGYFVNMIVESFRK